MVLANINLNRLFFDSSGEPLCIYFYPEKLGNNLSDVAEQFATQLGANATQ